MRKALVATLVLACVAGVAHADSPTMPPRDRWFAANDFGYWSDGSQVRIDQECLSLPASEHVSCSLAAFRARPFVVIALVDTGINVYHEDFRAPEFVHHPSEYVSGYPATARALRPSFDVADAQGFAAARTADFGLWLTTASRRLHWVPGTRIIGAYSTSNEPAEGAAPFPARAIIDDHGHGTGVASVAAGRYFGSNPNALIVAVEGLGEESLRWATSQPWIDIVSNSWGPALNAPSGNASTSREATERGQSVLFAAGNGATNTSTNAALPPDLDPCRCRVPDSNPSFTSPYGGSSSVVTVGAASPVNGQAYWWHSIPVDVASFGSKWRAASAFGVRRSESRDFGGTSCATPVTAGVLASVIERARVELDDVTEGQRPEQVVAAGSGGPAVGPLSDGALTRAEAEGLVLRAAEPVPADPERITWDFAVRPTTDTYYVFQGYGVVDRAAKQRALDVLMGRAAQRDRSDVDGFIATVDVARDALWARGS